MKFAIDQNLEVILLDFDGTLVPSEEIFFSAYQKNVFNEFGLDIKFADYKQHELHSDAKLFSVLKEKTNVAITEDQFMNKVYQDYGLAIEKLFLMKI